MRRVNGPAAAAWLILTLLISVGAFAPFEFDTSVRDAAAKAAKVRLNPLISPETGRRVSLPDVAQNLLAFAPFGAAGVVCLNRGRRRAAVIAKVAAAALAASTAIELVQLFLPERTSSLTDVIADTLGALFGAAAAGAALDWIDDRPRVDAAFQAWTSGARFTNMAAVLALIAAAAWRPFDPTLDVEVVHAHVEALVASLQAPSLEAVANAIRGVLLGIVLEEWLAHTRIAKRPRIVATLSSAIVAGLVLGSEVLIESRTPSVTDAIVLGAAAISGSAIAPHFRDASLRRRVGWALALVTAGLLVPVMTRPRPVHTMDSLSRAFDVAILAAQAVVCVAALTRSNARV